MADDRKTTRRAIVADDDEFFRLAMTAILTRTMGFSDVVETSSLDEALARLGDCGPEGQVALALFDLEMPGMAGAASLSAVRECFPSVLVVVVVVTASTRRRDVLLALEAGIHGYVSKGLGVVEITKAIASILEGSIFVPPWLAEAPPTDQPSAIVPETGPDTVRTDAAAETAHLANTAIAGLTRRQREVLRLIVDGKANKEIARALCLGEGTVKVHVAALLRALRVGNRVGAAALGARLLDAADDLA